MDVTDFIASVVFGVIVTFVFMGMLVLVQRDWRISVEKDFLRCQQTVEQIYIQKKE